MSEPQPKEGWLQKIRKRLPYSRTARTKDVWKRMHQEGGFIPLFNMDDIESRRNEIGAVLEEVKQKLIDAKDDPEKVLKAKEESSLMIYALFMSTGSPWYRGLDNPRLAKKVQAFLELYEYIQGIGGPFVDDLFMCGMQLLNLSWQELDVTNLPPYILETATKYEVKPPEARVKVKEEVEEY